MSARKLQPVLDQILEEDSPMRQVWEVVSSYEHKGDTAESKALTICWLVCELYLSVDDSGVGNTFSGREKATTISKLVEDLVTLDSDPRNNQGSTRH